MLKAGTPEVNTKELLSWSVIHTVFDTAAMFIGKNRNTGRSIIAQSVVTKVDIGFTFYASMQPLLDDCVASLFIGLLLFLLCKRR